IPSCGSQQDSRNCNPAQERYQKQRRLLRHAMPRFLPGAASTLTAAQKDGSSQKTNTPVWTWVVSKRIGSARCLDIWYTSADPTNDIESATANAAQILTCTLCCRIVPACCARSSRTCAVEPGSLVKVNS